MNGRKARAYRKAHPHTAPHVPAAILFEPRNEDDRAPDGPLRPRTEFIRYYANNGLQPEDRVYYRPAGNRSSARAQYLADKRQRRRFDRFVTRQAFTAWRFDNGYTFTDGAPGKPKAVEA